MVLLNSGPAGHRLGPSKLSAIGQRFERSFAGEAVISALATLVLLIGVVWNLPASEAKRTLTPTLHPIAAATKDFDRSVVCSPNRFRASKACKFLSGWPTVPSGRGLGVAAIE